MNDANSDLGYCGEAARLADPERFLATLFSKKETRDALWTILAFNAELAKARRAVSEPHIGLIRLQWWREALDEIEAGEPERAHPIVRSLKRAHVDGGIRLDLLQRVIDGREADMDEAPFVDEQALISYTIETGGALHVALGVVCGVGDEMTARLSAAGQAWRLTGLARLVADGKARDWQVGPQGWSDDETIRRLTSLSRSAFEEARGRVDQHARAALLPAALLPLHWAKLAAGERNSDPARLGQIVRLGWAATIGKI